MDYRSSLAGARRKASHAIRAFSLWFAQLYSGAVRLLYIWRVSRAKIDLNAKCPGCGFRKGKGITYVREFARIVHSCSVCGALWLEESIVAPQYWALTETEANRLAKPPEPDADSDATGQ